MSNFNLLQKAALKTAGAVGTIARKVYQHRADILMVSGAVGLVVSTADACNRTPKATIILDDARKELDDIQQARELADEEKYSQKDYVEDLVGSYKKTFIRFLKEYWKDILLFSASVGFLFAARQCWKNQVVRISTELAGVTSALVAYRGRVKDRVGEKVENDIWYGVEEKTMVVTNGEETEEKDISVVDEEKIENRPYSVVFSKDTAPNTFKTYNMGVNEETIKVGGAWANNMLEMKGYVFLNDILEEMGIMKRKSLDHIGAIRKKGSPISGLKFNVVEDVYTIDKKDPNIANECLIIEFPGFYDIYDELQEEY